MTDISNCCGASINVHRGGEGTNYYVCGACGEPCDPATPKDLEKENATLEATITGYDRAVEKLRKENAELKAEVERLKCFPSAHEYDRINRETATREKYIADLKAELEAVRKELADLKSKTLLPETLLDVHAICEERDSLRAELYELKSALKMAGEAVELYRSSHNVCVAEAPQGLCNKCRIAEEALSNPVLKRLMAEEG